MGKTTTVDPHQQYDVVYIFKWKVEQEYICVCVRQGNKNTHTRIEQRTVENSRGNFITAASDRKRIS